MEHKDLTYHVDLNKVLDKTGMTKTDLGRILFPMNIHVLPALDRVINGPAELSESQVARLAMKLDISIGELYDMSSWKAKSKDKVLYFSDDDFEAELDTVTNVLKFYKKKELVQHMALVCDTTKVSDFINHLNRLKNDHN